MVARLDNGTWTCLVHHASSGPPPIDIHPRTTQPGGAPKPEDAEYLTGDVTPPRKVVEYRPTCPGSARANGTEGKVILEIIVNKKGPVSVYLTVIVEFNLKR